MNERIDHVAEAQWAMGASRDHADQGNEWRSEYLMKHARVHATLALVEQQQIANLIALSASRHRILCEQVAMDAAEALARFRPHDDAVEQQGTGWHEIRPDIATALGLGDADD